jgi:predicted GIY-YIG superfamily endonuclease
VKKNCIYILFCEKTKDIKVGVTNDINGRLKNVQTGNPEKVSVYYYQEREDAYKVESKMKKKFNKYQSNGEWFKNIKPKEVKLFLLSCIN